MQPWTGHQCPEPRGGLEGGPGRDLNPLRQVDRLQDYSGILTPLGTSIVKPNSSSPATNGLLIHEEAELYSQVRRVMVPTGDQSYGCFPLHQRRGCERMFCGALLSLKNISISRGDSGRDPVRKREKPRPEMLELLQNSILKIRKSFGSTKKSI